MLEVSKIDFFESFLESSLSDCLYKKAFVFK